MPRRNDVAGVRQQRGEQRVGLRAVVGAGRFEQRDGLGDGAALRRAGRAGSDAEQAGIGSADGGQIRRRITAPVAFRICSSTSFALAGIGVPGP